MSLRKVISNWFLASWWFVPPTQPVYEPPKRPELTVKRHTARRCPTGPKRGVYISHT